MLTPLLKSPAASVLLKKVEIICLDHSDHDKLLQSCDRECSHLFDHSVVWFYHGQGKAQVE